LYVGGRLEVFDESAAFDLDANDDGICRVKKRVELGVLVPQERHRVRQGGRRKNSGAAEKRHGRAGLAIFGSIGTVIHQQRHPPVGAEVRRFLRVFGGGKINTPQVILCRKSD